VNWGVLSTARINELFLAGAEGSSEVKVVAVASRDLGTAERFASQHGIARAHAGYDALLADDDVEVVYVPLPNGMHVEWAIKALEAGKHVLCEKPLSRRPDEVERAFDVAARSDRLLMEAFMYRHNPQTKRVVELIADGAIGTPRAISSAFSFLADDPKDVKLTAEPDGGSLMDVGCYCVNAARMIAGEPDRVIAEQVTNEAGIDLSFAAVMRFPGDVVAVFDSGIVHGEREWLEIAGDRGTIRLADPWHCLEPVIEVRGGGVKDEVERIELVPVDSYRLEAENLVKAIRGEEPQLLGRDDAVGQAQTIEALYESAAAGRAVTLS
jgi:predicted dehydrogenase